MSMEKQLHLKLPFDLQIPVAHGVGNVLTPKMAAALAINVINQMRRICRICGMNYIPTHARQKVTCGSAACHFENKRRSVLNSPSYQRRLKKHESD